MRRKIVSHHSAILHHESHALDLADVRDGISGDRYEGGDPGSSVVLMQSGTPGIGRLWQAKIVSSSGRASVTIFSRQNAVGVGGQRLGDGTAWLWNFAHSSRASRISRALMPR